MTYPLLRLAVIAALGLAAVLSLTISACGSAQSSQALLPTASIAVPTQGPLLPLKLATLTPKPTPAPTASPAPTATTEPLTYVQGGGRLAVALVGLTPVESGTKVELSIKNVAVEMVDVPIDAFTLVVEGLEYVATNAATTLGPDQRTPVELTLPLHREAIKGLRVRIYLPPDPVLIFDLEAR